MARVVLVVDDEPLILDLTSSMLEELGCEVVTAGSAYEALQVLDRHERIDLLVTDIQMPDMNEYALAEEAHRLRQNLKVTFVSGQAPRRDISMVQKPFNRDELARVMEQTTRLC